MAQHAVKAQRIRASPKTAPGEFWYLVSPIGLPMAMSSPVPELDVVPFAQRACEAAGLRLRTVRLLGVWPKERHTPVGPTDKVRRWLQREARRAEMRRELRWAISLPDGHRDDAAMARIADRLRLIHAVFGDSWDRLAVTPLPDQLVSKAGTVSYEKLLAWVKADTTWRPSAFEVADVQERLGSLIQYHEDLVLWLWACLPALADPVVERAASYLLESHERAWFANPDRWDMGRAGETMEGPVLPSEIARFESAVVNAFKVVEAFLGNMKPDETEIRRRLLAQGFDPNVQIRIRPEVGLSKELEILAQARDARAAHGSGARKNIVTYYEVMGWQMCAQDLVFQALNRRNSVRQDLLRLLLKRRLAG